MNPPDDFTWRQIKAFGARPGITSPAEYAQAVERGAAAAKSVAQGFTSGPWLDTAQITTLHWAAYREVYPWAGQIRDQELHRGGEFFSQPGLIRSDLKALNFQSRDWFDGKDLQVLAKQMAAYNAAFYKIHPFLEGNFVVGQVLLEHQCREIFAKNINLTSDERVYRASLTTAIKGNFSQLSAQILEHAGFSRLAQGNAVEKLMRESAKQLKEREKGMDQSW